MLDGMLSIESRKAAGYYDDDDYNDPTANIKRELEKLSSEDLKKVAEVICNVAANLEC